jgi:hypothetical protein
MTGEQAPNHHPDEALGDAAHGAADDGEDGGHDDHGHDAEALGPVDVMAWGAFVLGAGLGLAVAICIALATADIPA